MLDPSFLKRMAVLTAAGSEMAVAVIAGTVVGAWLDARLGTSPVALVGLSLAGLSAGVHLLVRAIGRFDEDDDDRDDR